ncbi:MAG: endo-1,4-beta-xylanase [Calothrix sp. MO_192.B10]|nr:endo-1,4-beta-xylanase [Calothrix sp. MO_192.B10]
MKGLLTSLFIFLLFSGAASSQTLKSSAEYRKVLMGTAVRAYALPIDKRYRNTLAQNFNKITPENDMKMARVQPTEGVFTFAKADSVVEFARKNSMLIHGHTLVWHQEMPSWVERYRGNAPALEKILKSHIQTVVGHYKGKVQYWDVVNEAIERHGYRNTIWYDTLGKDFIRRAFIYAHNADPAAKLIYNDYDIATENQKSKKVLSLLSRLRKAGTPVCAVGLQMHISENGINYGSFRRMIQKYASLGLEVHITEMDVKIKKADEKTTVRSLEKQKVIYKKIARICAESPACKSFTTWGFTDKYTWIPGFTGGRYHKPLLFTESYARKPSFYGVIDGFRKAQPMDKR